MPPNTARVCDASARLGRSISGHIESAQGKWFDAATRGDREVIAHLTRIGLLNMPVRPEVSPQSRGAVAWASSLVNGGLSQSNTPGMQQHGHSVVFSPLLFQSSALPDAPSCLSTSPSALKPANTTAVISVVALDPS